MGTYKQCGASIGVNANQQETMIINKGSMGISRRYWELIGIDANQNQTKESIGVNGNEQETQEINRRKWEHIRD